VTALPDVRLRPVTIDDVPAIEAGMDAAADPFNFAGFADPGWLRAAVVEGRTLRPDGGRLAVAAPDGPLLGDVSWRQVRTGGSVHSWCWGIGISLLSEHRGRGYGAAAQRALAAYLFDTTPVARVEADTDVENVAEQRALVKAGFTREGVLRRAQWRAGGWHDMVLYSVLRGEL
jgi:RimJ/RimL family protein N-acetyltransferase